jgi:TonB family protein
MKVSFVLGLGLAVAACGTAPAGPETPQPGGRTQTGTGKVAVIQSPPGAPATLPAQAAKKLLVTDISKDPYRPRLPAHLNQAGASYQGLYRICVNAGGQIDAVKVVKSTGQDSLDDEWMQVIRTWRYMPLAINNKRRPFCYVSRVEVTAGS